MCRLSKTCQSEGQIQQKPYSGRLNPAIHQSGWPTKVRAVLEKLQCCVPVRPVKPYLGLLNPPIHQSEWPKGQSSFGKPVCVVDHPCVELYFVCNGNGLYDVTVDHIINKSEYHAVGDT